MTLIPTARSVALRLENAKHSRPIEKGKIRSRPFSLCITVKKASSYQHLNQPMIIFISLYSILVTCLTQHRPDDGRLRLGLGLG